MINIETGVGGRVYQIWKQSQACSCGVASAWMARGIALQMSYAEEEWELAQRIYLSAVNTAIGAADTIPSAPMTIDPRAHRSVPHSELQSSFQSNFSRAGLTCRQLATALQNDGLHVRVQHNNDQPTRVTADRIAFNKPAISFVQWPRGGAHFVVVGRCVPNHVTFLDPWTGHINEQPNNGLFRASYNQGTILVNLYVSA
jgi:hypothetical protein